MEYLLKKINPSIIFDRDRFEAIHDIALIQDGIKRYEKKMNLKGEYDDDLIPSVKIIRENMRGMTRKKRNNKFIKKVLFFYLNFGDRSNVLEYVSWRD